MVGRRVKEELGWLFGEYHPRRAKPHSPKSISDRLMKLTLKLCGQTRAVMIVVAYAPTDSQAGRKKVSCTALDRVVKDVPEHEHLFVLMDANTRMGRRGGKA